MGHILVVGSVNIDRVWWLGAPLRSGTRLSYERRELRCGGGGFNTGATLLALGHSVTIVTTIAGDDVGRAALGVLGRLGFDASHVKFSGARTIPLEILVDPSGERTILAPESTESRRITELPHLPVDAAYVNVRRMAPHLLAELPRRTKVVAQLPLQPGECRPAHVLIGSVSDGGLAARQDAFAGARLVGGTHLATLVLTDGSRPVRIFDGAGETRVEVTPRARPADTTGAGDVFAGGYVDAYLRGASPAEAVRHANDIAARFLADRGAFWDPGPLHLDPDAFAGDRGT